MHVTQVILRFPSKTLHRDSDNKRACHLKPFFCHSGGTIWNVLSEGSPAFSVSHDELKVYPRTSFMMWSLIQSGKGEEGEKEREKGRQNKSEDATQVQFGQKRVRGIFIWKHWQVKTLEKGSPSSFHCLLLKPWSSLPMPWCCQIQVWFSAGTFFNFSVVVKSLDHSTFLRCFLPPAFLVFLDLIACSFISSFCGFSPSQNLRVLSCMTIFLAVYTPCVWIMVKRRTIKSNSLI